MQVPLTTTSPPSVTTSTLILYSVFYLTEPGSGSCKSSANDPAVNVLSLNSPGQAKNIQKVDIAGPVKKAGLKISAFLPLFCLSPVQAADTRICRYG